MPASVGSMSESSSSKTDYHHEPHDSLDTEQTDGGRTAESGSHATMDSSQIIDRSPRSGHPFER